MDENNIVNYRLLRSVLTVCRTPIKASESWARCGRNEGK